MSNSNIYCFVVGAIIAIACTPIFAYWINKKKGGVTIIKCIKWFVGIYFLAAIPMLLIRSTVYTIGDDGSVERKDYGLFDFPKPKGVLSGVYAINESSSVWYYIRVNKMFAHNKYYTVDKSINSFNTIKLAASFDNVPELILDDAATNNVYKIESGDRLLVSENVMPRMEFKFIGSRDIHHRSSTTNIMKFILSFKDTTENKFHFLN